MRKFSFIIISVLLITGTYSCEETPVNPGFEDMEQMTIWDYILENEEKFSSFKRILEEGGISKTMSAYNPDGIGYTLFLPDNAAIERFIDTNDQFSSLEDMLLDKAYVQAFSRFHAVNLAILTNDFPFGALPEYTLSLDFLTVNFVIETDTSYYKINNQAPVVYPNVELSNGIVHEISEALIPVTYTSYEWLKLHSDFSIFVAALEATGLSDSVDFNQKELENIEGTFTMFVEPDSVYNRNKIYDLEDLIAIVSPDDADYTSPENPLYNYVAYHVLEENYFLDDFSEISSNFSTFSEIPLHVNGTGLEIMINKGKQIFDTLVVQEDTTIIDYVGFYYDQSNILTQSGAIHFINQVLRRQKPTRAIQNYQFYNEPTFHEYRQEPGSYIIEDSSALSVISYSGTDLFFIKEADEEHPAWDSDYLLMNGDFIINYDIPKIIQGKYVVFIGAEAFSESNAIVEVFIDGKNMGGLIDLKSGGSSNNPFARVELGTIDFTRYEGHRIQIRSLIPGRFLWDYLRFEPFKK